MRTFRCPVLLRRVLLAVVVATGVPAATVDAQTPAAMTNGQVYGAACAACHASDGRGHGQAVVGFDTPIPDFSDCSFATREPDADWFAIGHQGGPVRGFDRRMPAFGQALSAAELQQALGHIRTFCGDQAWPRGELNLPRPLVTEKAYPEDEAVLTTVVDGGAVSNEFLYEKRFGARSQYEVVVPFELRQQEGEGWRRGLGDIAVAVKHVLSHSLESGRILSVTGELVLPTGKENEGLGKGVTVFEPFVTFGQVLPADAFIQAMAGFELPASRDHASNEAFWRVAAGKSFVEGEFGRTWSPMAELLGARELGDGHSVLWDVVPQVQVTLNRRQHIMINVGVRIPMNQREGRSTQVLTYFLWDWFDGGLFDGWR